MPKPLGVRALLTRDGYTVVRGVFGKAEIDRLISLHPDLGDSAGTRTLLEHDWAGELADCPEVRQLVSKASLGRGLRPTKAILFDKSPSANWVLGWHQDQIAAMPERFELRGFSQWTEKEGQWHCRPPKRIQESGLAVRIHLDDCGPDNGPLRVLPGTHRDGYRKSPTLKEQAKEVVCTCEAGDVILMRPLLFHASGKALSPSHRRVIHIEYRDLMELTAMLLMSIYRAKRGQ